MKLKRSIPGRSSSSSETEMETKIQEEVKDVLRESEVEIKPASDSNDRGKPLLLALIVCAIAVGYWLRKSQKPTETLQSEVSETADQTKQVTEQAADTIKEGSETVSERVEEGSEKASEQVEQTGETIAEEAEEAGEMAAEKADQSGSDSTDGSANS